MGLLAVGRHSKDMAVMEAHASGTSHCLCATGRAKGILLRQGAASLYFGVGGRQEPCPLNPLQVVWVTGASAGFGEALCVALCQADAWQVLEGSALAVKWSRSKGKTWGTDPERSAQG